MVGGVSGPSPAHRYGRAGAVVSALLKAHIFAALKARAERSGLQSNETPVLFIMDEAQEIATGVVTASRYQATVREFVAIPSSKLAHSGWQRFTAPIANALR